MPPSAIITLGEDSGDLHVNNYSDVIPPDRVYQAIDFSEMPGCGTSLHRRKVLVTSESNGKAQSDPWF